MRINPVWFSEGDIAVRSDAAHRVGNCQARWDAHELEVAAAIRARAAASYELDGGGADAGPRSILGLRRCIGRVLHHHFARYEPRVSTSGLLCAAGRRIGKGTKKDDCAQETKSSEHRNLSAAP